MLQLSCWNMLVLEHEATSDEALPEDDGALGESMEDTTGASMGTHECGVVLHQLIIVLRCSK